MGRKITYWLTTRLLASLSIFAAFTLPIGQPASGSRICPRGIPAATAHYSWDRQTPWRDRPGERWPERIHAADIAATPRDLLCDPAGKSSVEQWNTTVTTLSD
jgi:hypothetical protein